MKFLEKNQPTNQQNSDKFVQKLFPQNLHNLFSVDGFGPAHMHTQFTLTHTYKFKPTNGRLIDPSKCERCWQ